MFCRAEPDPTFTTAPSHSLHLPLDVFDFDSSVINGDLLRGSTQDGTTISPAHLDNILTNSLVNADLDVYARSGALAVVTEAARGANVKGGAWDNVNARVTDKDKDASVTLWCSPRLDPGLFIGENQFCGDVGSLSSLVSGLRSDYGSGRPMSGGFPVNDVVSSRISHGAGAAVKEDPKEEEFSPLDASSTGITRGSDLFTQSKSSEREQRQATRVGNIPFFSGNGERKVAEKSLGGLRGVLAHKQRVIQPSGVEEGFIGNSSFSNANNNESFNGNLNHSRGSDASPPAVNTMEDSCCNGEPCIMVMTDMRNTQAARSSDASLILQGEETGSKLSFAPFHGDLNSVPTVLVETNQ